MDPRTQFSNPYLPGIFLFFLSFLIALYCYKDYGISWDEPIQRSMGATSYKYVFNGDKTLLTDGDRDHGVAFEMPLIFIEKAFKITDYTHVYLMRHFVTHVFFLVSAFFGYILAYRLYKNKTIACLAFILLVFNPRIYAHSYFNTKDIPFLSALIIILAIAQIAFEKNKVIWYVLLGAVTGYATSIRAMGILFAVCICLFFIVDVLYALLKRQNSKTLLVNFLLFVTAFCGVLYITWPILWSAPWFYFKEEFLSLAHIPWIGTVLLNGTFYATDKLPWTYVPIWFSITIPELWLFLGAVGVAWVSVLLFKNLILFVTNTTYRNYLLYVLCFFLPVLSVTLLHSINYDDWRHLYFIYPAFVMLVLFAINKLVNTRAKKILVFLCVLQVMITSFFMIRYHPFQQVYFNYLVAHKEEYLRKNFDLDYWGCSDKQGLEFILEHDTSSVIRVCPPDQPVINNVFFLGDAVSKRFKIVGPEDHPDYFITNFRGHPDDYNYSKIFCEKKVLNSTILAVYKMN